MSASFQWQAGGPSRRFAQRGGFTILELLVGMVIFAFLLVVLLSTISQTSSIWQRARNEAGSFQSARFAFNLITRTLGQATLNTYIDYDNPGLPTKYLRKSDLAFAIVLPSTLLPPTQVFGQGNAVFFEAKLGSTANLPRHGGLDGLLNAVGYYVTYGTYAASSAGIPSFLSSYDKPRFRLMQYLQPSENLKVSSTTNNSWFIDDLAAYSNVVADDVILILFWPKLSDQEDSTGTKLTDPPNGDQHYTYDSRKNASSIPQPDTANQQPPQVQITMVAIDKISADRLGNSSTPPGEITSALSGLFATPGKSQYQNDLQTLQARLNTAHIGYRVFNSTVALKESKWSK